MTEKKLHVLQVTGAMNRGGAEIMLMNIYRNLSPHVRFDFLINFKIKNPKPHGDFDNEILHRGGRLLYIGTQWDLGVISYIEQFRTIIMKIGKPDVVHIHLNAKCGVIALAARLCGVKKIIAHSHAALNFRGPFFQILPSSLELQLQKILIALFATDFWGCSQVAIQSLFYRRFCKNHRTVIVNNAIDVAAFQSVDRSKTEKLLNSYGVKAGTLVIGNVGRVVRNKKIDFVIDVLRILNERDVDFLFIFAGREDDKAYMNEIVKKIKEYAIEHKVLYIGDQDDIPTLMSIFDVFVGPSMNEGFGLVAAEAQAAGVPCILSTGFPINVDMGIGLVTYIDNYSPDRWADSILRKKGNKCFDKVLIRQQIVIHGFDAAENTRQIEKLYWKQS